MDLTHLFHQRALGKSEETELLRISREFRGVLESSVAIAAAAMNDMKDMHDMNNIKDMNDLKDIKYILLCKTLYINKSIN